MSQPGAYILENTPPPPGEKISANVIWGEKYEKANQERGESKRKKKKGERKGRKGKESEKRGSKRVK
jgi:hypothetical protein